ncbi:alpha-mannosidase [Anaerobacterium chartisolvens]|uniref:Alpha-mannosidase n=1 Tax=Anaerobacterium chartisolvens TaxID=1297424 RepID=A0A369AIQ5_9FIRM|nr:carbohydrate-binding protein [Anaerobacterium chartisolvens]RCX08166.1 alpha-mannosidase [Anaerobacterium chartisolvens]
MKKTKQYIAAFLIIMIMIMSSSPVLAASVQKPKLYVTATAHLDTMWNWPIDSSIKQYLPNTLNSNFLLMDKYPNYKFNFEGAFRYQLIKEYYPDLYEKMKQYIQAGRWHTTGAVWENGDVNVPSPEALMRNILYGNKFFEKEFGAVNTDLFLPDCFGFGYSLPTIASHMGLKSFSSSKLVWSNVNFLPFDLGVWKGVDGSSVIASLNPDRYLNGIAASIQNDSGMLNKIKGAYNDSKLSEYDVKRMMKYYGTGDQGGAPSEDSIKNMESAVSDANGLIEVISAYPGQMEEEMTASEIAALGEYQGELQMKFHGNGTFTASAVSKLLNRKNEQLADAAERASVAAGWLGVREYPAENLRDAWLRVIAAQHHDNLTGTSIAAVYADAINDYVIALNKFAGELKTSASGVISAMDTNVASGIPVVIYNPVSADRQDVAEASVTLDEPSDYVRVYNSAGQEVPSQVSGTDGKNVKLVFLADVKANGYAVYSVVPSQAPCSIDTGLSVTASSLENHRYRIEIDDNGDISGIYDKEYSKQILDEPITLQQFANTYTNYGIWEISYSDYIKGPSSVVGNQNKKVTVTEDGAARVSLQIQRTHNASVYTQTVSLAAGEGGNRVDVNNDVMWGEKTSFMKASFPLTVYNRNATYDLGIGTIERDNSDPNQYEMPAQQWADITDEDGTYGVTILNDSKYGWDKPADNEIRLTLFHVPQEERADNSKQNTFDFGENKFTYSIMGHAGDWRDGKSQYEAANLNQPLQAYQTTSHYGSLPKDFSFASLSTGQVMIKAIKKAEDTEEYIVRVNELHGSSAKGVTLKMGDGIHSFRPVNGYEDQIEDSSAELVNGELKFDITAYAPKTFAVTLESHSGTVVKPSIQPVDISALFNIDIISSDRNKSDGGFGSSRFTFPSEILPDDRKVVSGGVEFMLGSYSDGDNNAVKAKGQSIALPQGSTRVYLLAGSQRHDKDIPVWLGDRKHILDVQSMWEYVGSWDQYGLARYGSIKRGDIALVANHTHDPSGDMVYDKSYLYKYELDIPQGVSSMTLPDDSDLIIAGISVQTNDTYTSSSISALYPEKEVNKGYMLDVVDGSSKGVYHYGNPVAINYTGGELGRVIWNGDDGSKYYGESIMINMPDYNLTLTPEVTSYGENLALNRPVQVSGENGNEPGWKAVDGTVEDNSKWCTGSDSWLIVDLGEEKAVDTYVLRNTGNGRETEEWNTADFQIQVEDENGEWRSVDSVMANRLNVYTGSFSPVYARYVRLNVTKPTQKSERNNATRIYEFELYSTVQPAGEVMVSDPVVTLDGLKASVLASAYGGNAGGEISLITRIREKNGTFRFTDEKKISLTANAWGSYTSLVDFSSVSGVLEQNDDIEVYFADAQGNKLSKTVKIKNIGSAAIINGLEKLEAENMTKWSEGGLKIESSSTAAGEALVNVGGTYNGAWLAYRNVNFGDKGVNAFTAHYVNNSGRCASDAVLEIRLDSVNGTVVGTVQIPATGSSWISYSEITASLDQKITGMHDVYIIMKGSTDSGHPFIANLDYFKFNNFRGDYSYLELESYDEWSGGNNPVNGQPIKTEGGKSGQQIANTYDGAWLAYKSMDFGAEGVDQIAVEYCGNRTNCAEDSAVEVRLGSVDGELVGKVETPPTAGGWGTYAVAAAELNKKITGVQDVYLVLTGSTDATYKYIGNFDNASFSLKPVEEEPETRGDYSYFELESYDEWCGGNNPANGQPIKTEGGKSGQQIANTYDGAWLAYKAMDFGAEGVDQIAVEYTSNSTSCAADSAVEVRLGSVDGELVGTVETPPTAGGWGTYAVAAAELSRTITGVQDVYLVLTGSTDATYKYVGNFDNASFSLKPVEEEPETRSDYSNLELESYDEWCGGNNPANNQPIKTEGGKSGQQIANTYSGAWLAYKSMDFGAGGVDQIAVEYTSNSTNCAADSAVEVRLGAVDGELVGTVETPPTADSWGTYSVATAELNKKVTGVQDVYLVLTGSTDATYKYVGNFDNASFSLKPVEEEPETRGDYSYLELESYDEWCGGINPANNQPIKTEGGKSGQQIANTYSGAWLAYKSMDFGAEGVDQIAVEYTSNSTNCAADSAVEVRLGAVDGELVGRVETPPTAGGWGTYAVAVAELNRKVTGVQDVYLVLTGSTDATYKYVGNFDNARFSLKP